MGAPDTTSPYSFSLNTTKFGNGSHTIGAYAWDPSQNLGNAVGVAVTFSNASAGQPGGGRACGRACGRFRWCR